MNFDENYVRAQVILKYLGGNAFVEKAGAYENTHCA